MALSVAAHEYHEWLKLNHNPMALLEYPMPNSARLPGLLGWETPSHISPSCPLQRSPLEEERALKEALRSAWENEALERTQTEEKLHLGEFRTPWRWENP